MSRLEEELTSKNKAFHILEERLKTQDDYEEIKRELRYDLQLEYGQLMCAHQNCTTA